MTLKLPVIAVVFLGWISGLAGSAAASEPHSIDRLIQQAEAERLHLDPYWSALVHYRSRTLAGIRSDIHSADFFLSKVGDEDPERELRATVEGMLRPLAEGENPDLHPQCRFIARFNWLKKKLDWNGIDLPKVECPGFKAFSFDGGVESISLVFATGYLGNPASFFGHPVMRFNLFRKKVPSQLLDTSVNYGAITPYRENPFVYAFKGLMGGYSATFSHRNFYYNTHYYSENELRDMWDYELNLTPDEINQVLWHTWELLGRDFSYYFLSDNCASRMAEHLKLVLGKELLPAYVPWAVPYTLFDNLAHEVKRDGSPVVRRFTHIPSRQARLRQKYLLLPETEKEVVRAVVAAHGKIDSETFVSVPESDRSRVIETLMDYYEFRRIGDPEDPGLKAIKARLLAARARLPAGAWEARPVATPPHEGQRSVLTGVSAFQSEKFKTGFELRIRPAYFDFLALDAGRPPASSVGIFDFRFAYADGNFGLRAFDFINVETLNISQTGLPGDGGMAWKLNIGAEPLNLACTSCLVAKLDLGVGKAIRLFENQVLFAMLDARVQTSAQDSGNFAATPNVGALLDLVEGWKAMGQFGYRMYLGGAGTREPVLRVESRFGAWRDRDIRLTYEKHVDQRAGISFNFYW